MKGRTIPRLTNLPILHSNSYAFTSSLSIILMIAVVQARNLFSESDKSSCLKSEFHPKIVFVSSAPASARSFTKAAISSLGIGLERCFWHAAMWIARKIDSLSFLHYQIEVDRLLSLLCFQCIHPPSLLDLLAHLLSIAFLPQKGHPLLGFFFLGPTLDLENGWSWGPNRCTIIWPLLGHILTLRLLPIRVDLEHLQM